MTVEPEKWVEKGITIVPSETARLGRIGLNCRFDRATTTSSSEADEKASYRLPQVDLGRAVDFGAEVKGASAIESDDQRVGAFALGLKC